MHSHSKRLTARVVGLGLIISPLMVVAYTIFVNMLSLFPASRVSVEVFAIAATALLFLLSTFALEAAQSFFYAKIADKKRPIPTGYIPNSDSLRRWKERSGEDNYVASQIQCTEENYASRTPEEMTV